MARLSEIETQRRLVVLTDRLEESRFIRTQGMKPDTAEVMMTISKGYYAGQPVNVSAIVKSTLMDKQTIMRHALKLANEPVPLISIKSVGQETILRMTEEAVMDPRAIAYFEFRYKSLVKNGGDLHELITM